PLATDTSQHGFGIRDASGILIGLDLSFPAAFLSGDQRILGLGAGSFFVEPQVRTLGFYLFKRDLKAPQYSFFFATTCNANPAALWKTLGAHAIPNFDTEYVFPLKLDVMLPASVAARTS